MPGFSNLLDWAEQAGLVAADEARRMQLVAGRNPREAAAIRARAVALREALHAIVHALLKQTLPDAAPLQTLQAEIMLARAAQQLVATGDGLGWDWTNPTALDRIVAEVSLAAEIFFTGTQVAALRHCAAPDCERVFLDTSRNGRRRYCTSDGCGTRERVRQFRQRQRVSNDTSSQEQP